MTRKYSFIIYGQPITKKNSSVMAQGKARILPSQVFRDYQNLFRYQLGALPKPLPHFDTGVSIEARYWLHNKASWPDLVGLMQATADIISDEYKVVKGHRQLQTQWLLADDRIIKRWDGTCIAGIDKKHPRVEVTITPLDIPYDEECDPYIIKRLKAQQQQNLFEK